MVTLSKPNLFIIMKRSRMEKSPWVKSKSKPGPKKKKAKEFDRDGRRTLAKSGKGSWFNQPAESETASASSLNVPGVSRKKIMGAKKAEESDVAGQPLPITSQGHSSLSDSENVVEDEACSKTWTFVNRKELNRMVEEKCDFSFLQK